MKLIILDKGQVSKVDDEDHAWLSQWNWYAKWNKHTKSYYACRTDNSGASPITIRMHRVLLGLEKGNKIQGDHINHDTLDNQKSNLRRATCTQNNCNRYRRTDNASGQKGVTWVSARGYWKATVWLNGKSKHLGFFPENKFDDACEAYRKAALEIHGDFANIGKKN